MKQFRIYLDTSVLGGCFDEEFSDVSNQLFNELLSQRSIIMVSDTTFRELQRAPKQVQEVLKNYPDELIEVLQPLEEVASGKLGSEDDVQ